MIACRILRQISCSSPSFSPPLSHLVKMSAKKIVDVFNEIDQEMTYIKNKLDSLGELVQGGAGHSDSAAALQKLREENKVLQKETLEILKQISVFDVLEGKPPLALKVFMQSKVEKATATPLESQPGEKVMDTAKVVKTAPIDTKKQVLESKGADNTATPVEPSKNKGKDKKAEKAEGTEVAKPSSDKVKESKETVVDESITVARLDFRVGKIVEVEKHPDADALYVEKIDLGEAQPRTIVSGLVKFVPIEEMKDRMVVVLCNLKPAKMRGVTSEGMVMCASTPDKVEILIPPKGSQPGDRVTFEGFPGTPDDVLNPKKKIWETVAPDLSVNPQKIAVYKGVPFLVAGKGHVMSPSLVNCIVK